MRRVMLPAAVVLGALLLRLIAVGNPLSHDEGYTWIVASAPDLGAFGDRLAAYENTPPLYYALVSLLPASEFWLRLPSVLAGTACVGALYWALLPLTGRRGALLSAALLAVAPYAVSYSDFARGFVVADLGLVVALGAAVRRRWWLYAAGAAIALWSEYDSALFLVALAGAVAWSGIAPAREALVRGLLPLAVLAPWIPEIVRGGDATGQTKVSPVYPGPSPATLRDTVVRLAFGEHGTARAAGLRWMQFAFVTAVLGVAARAAGRAAFRLLAGTAFGTLALHALVHAIGPAIFAPRYLTELVPLAAAILGVAAANAGRAHRIVVPALAVATGALGAAVAIQRSSASGEPDVGAIARVILPSARGRTVVTNSAVVAYYLRRAHPRLDRPFGLGPGLEAVCTPPCRTRFLVVDDARVANSPRAGPGRTRAFGPIHVRVTP